jgi:ribosomal protein S18 acetylase RimI-like enzyme
VNLQWRPASRADAEQVVPLIHGASRALLDVVFGDGARSFLDYDFRRGKGLFGHRNQVVGATPDGEVWASMTLYEGRRYRRLAAATSMSAARYLGLAGLSGVVRRAAPLAPMFARPRRDGLFLANICVAPARRGAGHGSALIRHAQSVARERGLAVLELDVSFSNARAQQLYERLGFAVVKSTGGRVGHQDDGFRRMSLTMPMPSGADSGRPRP